MGSPVDYGDSSPKISAIHAEDRALDSKNGFDASLDLTGSRLNDVARGGAEAERSLTTTEAVKIYPMALFWTVIVGM